ncbi:enoyl-CoA hydratase [Alphaproteobacteria bacterium]|mgnify:CR=1 FL=1|jgi:enoyl-CoA hydratase/carnithine racemase|nr:enoyl-CoA hydratase [Alphaproteobacteria bacterium]MDA9807527.1 enoyl-CoA hydratase [Alphaproteobacteria bacterium]MDB2479156.1 enoyl-CoA hydratase [Alphaproteobacteria bacterium]MDC0969854.1 enoyl-CoA hydratase [Alphaproteobacteria bacterium]
MTTEKMLSRVKDGVGYITFNNPEKHNAVSIEMWDALEQILDGFRSSQEIRVIVLSGAGGKAFVSGADISKFDKERSSKEAVLSYNKRTQKVYENLETFPKPTIAMIDGYCIGGGLNLAVCCDIRICSEKSKFAMPAAKLSLGYPFSSIKRLFDVMGPGMAKHFMFTAEKISASEALACGLVQKLVSEDSIDSYVKDYALNIANNAPLTIKAMKQIGIEISKNSDERDLLLCEKLASACFDSEDYKEGRKAFMEKRKPNFQGL